MTLLADLLVEERLEETYSQENGQLFRYFSKKPFSTSDLWDTLAYAWDGFDQALEDIGSSLSELNKLRDNDQYEEIYAICYRLDDWFDKNPTEKMDAAEAVVQAEPAEAPSWAYLDLNVKRLLPASTWLVHWTDDARSIAAKGFKHGLSDVTRLGLTKHFNDSAKKFGGYNFAFKASDVEDSSSYGSELVVFQSSGVECYHSGDEEDQVVFWGGSITSKPVAIVSDPDADDGKFVVLGANGEPVARLSGAVAAVKWVIAHGDRHRRSLR